MKITIKCISFFVVISTLTRLPHELSYDEGMRHRLIDQNLLVIEGSHGIYSEIDENLLCDGSMEGLDFSDDDYDTSDSEFGMDDRSCLLPRLDKTRFSPHSNS